MGPDALWSLAGMRPANLLVAILGDSGYSITGGQPLMVETRLAEMARSLPVLGVIEAGPTEAGPWSGPRPCVDPYRVRTRFAAALGG